MGKEKRAADGSVEKKAKKRKSTGTEEVADPIAETEVPTSVVAVPSIEKRTVLSPIAHPLADDKLKKKALKLVKLSAKGKQLKRGVKEVVKALRKDVKGWADWFSHAWNPISLLRKENSMALRFDLKERSDLGISYMLSQETHFRAKNVALKNLHFEANINTWA